MSEKGERLFPILGDDCIKSIPWAAIAPHEARALKNHSQTLERLAQRGGLCVEEAEFVLLDKPWARSTDPSNRSRARANLMKLVWLAARTLKGRD